MDPFKARTGWLAARSVDNSVNSVETMWVQLDGRGTARVAALLVVMLVIVTQVPALIITSLLPGCDRATGLLDKIRPLIKEILRDDSAPGADELGMPRTLDKPGLLQVWSRRREE